MQTLAELQNVFLKNLFQKESADLSFIASNFPNKRFDVYFQTIFENMVNSLKITYPGIWKLLGDECANNVARHYCTIEAFLPKTGCLDEFGESFSKFFSTLEPLNAFPYLEDYAYYEWLMHLAYIAENSKTISSLDLQNIPENRIGATRFDFIPSCFFFTSQYAIDDIHDLVKGENTDTFTLQKKIVYAVITRLENEIHTYWVKKDIWIFLKYLKNKNSLSQAIEYTEKSCNEFDLTLAMTLILKAQLVKTFLYRES